VTGPDSSGEHTRIIRRAPSQPPAPPADTRTGIIRRAPTGPFPAQPPPEPRTTYIPAAPVPEAPPLRVPEAPTGLIPAPPTTHIPEAATGLIPDAAEPTPFGGWSAIATCVVAILSGWAVSVVGTDLITGWWQTDRLFCLGVGFLTFVFAASTIAGVITLLLRRTIGRYLIATGAVVALLTFGSVFIAGAKVSWPVYVIPVLPIASVVLAFLPGTGRWTSMR
jgi:hypothetical protein